MKPLSDKGKYVKRRQSPLTAILSDSVCFVAPLLYKSPKS